MHKLKRSRRDSKFFGVCGGIAEYLDVDSTIVRLLVVILGLASVGTAIVIYLIAALIMPLDDGYTDI
jgi:phage shock protein PspC (stress-responsive transcriptional regulator)